MNSVLKLLDRLRKKARKKQGLDGGTRPSDDHWEAYWSGYERAMEIAINSLKRMQQKTSVLSEKEPTDFKGNMNAGP